VEIMGKKEWGDTSPPFTLGHRVADRMAAGTHLVQLEGGVATDGGNHAVSPRRC
jgi:hypothetical protein